MSYLTETEAQLRAALAEADRLIEAFIYGDPKEVWRPGSTNYEAWKNYEKRRDSAR